MKHQSTEGASVSHDDGRSIMLSCHPTTGNPRVSIRTPGRAARWHFFCSREAAIEWLEDALDLLDPEGAEQ